MGRICCFVACAFHLIMLTMAPVPAFCAAPTGVTDTKAALQRGIGVLASSIGSDYSPEDLAAVVQRGNFSPVVVDWAWVTAHWDRTDFPALNRFLDLMATQGVPVAAMYRPRFLDRPTVPTQVDRAGKPAAAHGYYICFSSAEARAWGIAWGRQILEKCPRFNEIIIYNPLNQCQCQECQKAAKANPYSHYDAVWQFVAEATAAWRKQRPEVKLGVVFVSDPEFWKRGSDVLDVAHPFLFVTEDTDLAKDAAQAAAIRDLLPGKMGPCLAKVTWGPNDKVSPARLAQFDRTAAAAGLPYFIWTFETLFSSDLYDPNEVAIALGIDQSVIPPATAKRAEQAPATVAREHPKAAPPAAGAPAGLTYTSEQIRNMSVEAFLERMLNPEPGYHQFAALQALAQKVKESEGPARREMVSMVAAVMKDANRPVLQRWQCCYVISGGGAEEGVPDLIEVLLHDSWAVVRSVAAEALADFPDNAAARDALLQAAHQETDPQVREVLARRLGKKMPAAQSGSAPSEVSESSSASPAGVEPGSATYTPEQVQHTSAKVFLDRMLHPEPGYHQFAAMYALTEKAKEGYSRGDRGVLSLVIEAMFDKRRPVYQRYQCCYVLSDSGDVRAVPDLIQVLLHDESEVMRGVAAEALAKFGQSAGAHDALVQAARQETDPGVRETLARHLREAMPASQSATAAGVEERAPTGPPEPPPGPTPPVAEPLAWPFPGGQEDQNIFNNYQQATDIYIHCGLDFIQPAGTPVTAVDSGYIAVIYTNYPDWITHYFFIVTPDRGGTEGWCYTHLDPRTFTFKEGDFVRQGERLGSLVAFSVGNQPGVSHLHLHYVRFSRDASGKVNVHSLLDPLYFFDWKDTEPPVFQPLRFVTEDMREQFPADAAGVVTVSGRVDILAAVTDSAYPGHMGNLGVAVMMLSISDGKHTMQKLVVDHRGDVGDETQVKPLYLSHDQKKAFFDPDSFPRYHMLRVTKTDGDGRIEPRDVRDCWNTTAQDARGRPLWPNGQYSVNVYAWDIAGNRAVVGALVRVRNR